jgi:phage terminase large subunit-like protein
MNIDALRTSVAMSHEGHFRVFHLGQWVRGTDCWLGPDGGRLWDALRDPYKPLSRAQTWVGVDVGIKRDSTAVVAVQRRPDGRLHAWAKLWVPSPGNAVDVTDVMEYLRRLAVEFDVCAVSFDPRFFDVPAKMLADEGLPMVELPQSVERMTVVCGALYEHILNGEISHDGDDTFTTHVLNAVPRYNAVGFTLQKAKSRGRIDACIALALAVDRAQRGKPKRAPLVIL